MRPFTLFSNTAKEVQKIPSELSGPSNMIDNGSTAAVAHILILENPSSFIDRERNQVPFVIVTRVSKVAKSLKLQLCMGER